MVVPPTGTIPRNNFFPSTRSASSTQTNSALKGPHILLVMIWEKKAKIQEGFDNLRNKGIRQRQISYDITHMWNLIFLKMI